MIGEHKEVTWSEATGGFLDALLPEMLVEILIEDSFMRTGAVWKRTVKWPEQCVKAEES